MLGTKVEITLPKAEPGKWTTLNLPKSATVGNAANVNSADATAQAPSNDNDSDVDLNDIEQVRGVKITDA